MSQSFKKPEITPELAAQLAVAREMLASSTKAGNKSRPSSRRGGGGGSNSRGSPFQSAPVRGPPMSPARPLGAASYNGPRTTINTPNFKAASPPKARGNVGAGVNSGFGGAGGFGGSAPITKIGPYSVGPLNSAAPAKAEFKAPQVTVTEIFSPVSPTVPPHSQNTPTVRAAPAAEKIVSRPPYMQRTPTVTAPASILPHTQSVSTGTAPALIPPHMQNVPTATAPASIPATVQQTAQWTSPAPFASVQAGIATPWAPNTVPQAALTVEASSSSMGASSSSVDGQVPIISNWSKDSVKIPAHLKQTSAFAVIQDAADLLDVSVEDLTSDGFSMPLPLKGPRAQGSSTLQHSIHAPRQPNVDPTGWFTAATSSKSQGYTTSGSGSRAQGNENQERPRVVSENMDWEVTDGFNNMNLGSQPAVHTQAPRTAPSFNAASAPAGDLGKSIWSEPSWSHTNKKENTAVAANTGVAHQPFGGGAQITTGWSNADTVPIAAAARPVSAAQAPRGNKLSDSRWA